MRQNQKQLLKLYIIYQMVAIFYQKLRTENHIKIC